MAGIALAASTNTTTCAGASPCGRNYNQVIFGAADVAGNVPSLGTYAILVDTMVPTGLSVVAAYQSSITVQWNMVAGATGYTLVASAVSGNPPSLIWASSTTVGVGVTTATVFSPALNSGTTYFLYVQSNYSSASSSFAGPVSTMTTGVGCTAWPNGLLLPAMAITIDYTQVPNTDQINFPFLFRGTYTALANQLYGGGVTSINGYDIIFSTDPNGLVRLPHEIETYSLTTGNVNMWTQLPTVSHSVNTVFYVFFGSASEFALQLVGKMFHGCSGTAVIKLVWHLPNGTTLGLNDSTSNGNNGTIVGTVNPTAGLIDGGAVIASGAN